MFGRLSRRQPLTSLDAAARYAPRVPSRAVAICSQRTHLYFFLTHNNWLRDENNQFLNKVRGGRKLMGTRE